MSGSDSTYAAIFGDGTSVLERVLLAIIEAHTTQETEGRQAERLQAAIVALIGPVTPRECDMERALLYMARQRQKDACDLEMDALRSCSNDPPRAARSVSKLATLAAREVLGCTTREDVRYATRTLCNLYRSRRNTYAMEYNSVEDALETEAVGRIWAELAEWGVPRGL